MERLPVDGKTIKFKIRLVKQPKILCTCLVPFVTNTSDLESIIIQKAINSQKNVPP